MGRLQENLINEMADYLIGWPIGDGYYQTNISTAEGYELAEFLVKELELE